MTTQADAKELVLTRHFNAPRALVFRCWTEPGRIARWWGPQGFTAKVHQWDARAGGQNNLDMISPDGLVYPMQGRFEQFVPPERLVMISAPLDSGGKPVFEVRTEITFAEHDGGTLLTLRAQPFHLTAAAAPYLAGMEVGWTQTLDRLEATVLAAAGEKA